MYIDIENLCILIGIAMLISMIKSKEWAMLSIVVAGFAFVGLMLLIHKTLGTTAVLVFVGILFVLFMIIREVQIRKEVKKERVRRKGSAL